MARLFDSALAAPRFLRSLLLLGLGLAGAAIGPSRVAAQVHSYGEFSDQREKLLQRASDLVEKIGSIDIKPVYCKGSADEGERRAIGRRLAELVAELGDLQRDWSQFRQATETFGRTTAGVTAFGPENRNPNDPNFWSFEGQREIDHARTDLESKREEFRNSKVIDCSAPKTSARPAPPAPPKPDPLAGLTRPTPRMQTLPAAPKPFCSEEEKWAWIRAVIIPLMNENIDASWALRNYGDAILERIQKLGSATPVDQEALDKLNAELKWELAEHKKWDDVYGDIIKLLNSAVVIDCTQHVTTGGAPPARPDTAHPRTQEKPGTGTPENQTPPKTGALPGGKRGGGEFLFGAGIDESWYQNFGHTAGDQQNIDTFDGKQTTPGWGVELGYQYLAWRVWVCRHVNRLHYTQSYNGGSPFSRVDGELDGAFYDFRVGPRVELRWNTYVEVFAGVTFAYDKLELTPVGGMELGGSLLEESRRLETWKTNVGFAIEGPIKHDLNWRLGMTYTGAGKTNDADANLRIGAGLTYRLPFKGSF